MGQDEVMRHIYSFAKLYTVLPYSILVLLLEGAHSSMDMLPEHCKIRYLHFKELAGLQTFYSNFRENVLCITNTSSAAGPGRFSVYCNKKE